MLSFFKPQELLFSQNIVSFLVLHPRLCHIIKIWGDTPVTLRVFDGSAVVLCSYLVFENLMRKNLEAR